MPQLSHRDALGLEFLGIFRITTLTLVRGKEHVLGAALSRIPQCMGQEISADDNLTKEETLLNAPGSIKEFYKVHKTFDLLHLAINGTFPKCVVE